jgi:hypothetical protein
VDQRRAVTGRVALVGVLGALALPAVRRTAMVR